MTHRKVISGAAIAALVFGLGWTSPVFASGGYGGGGGGYRGGGDLGRRPTSRTDTVYERGKRVARGRAASNRGFKVCLAKEVDAGAEIASVREAEALNRRSLRPYRDGRRASLVEHLVDCKDVDVLARAELSTTDMDALVHYLNKRFKLDL